MKVMIYCRVATAGQDGLDPLELQEQRLRAFAAAKGHEVAGCVCETATGMSLGRPSIQTLQTMAASGKMDAVLALSLSRLA